MGGDGFPVRSLFSYNTLGQHISPFLLLDYAGPADSPPAQQRRGVGQHPHRGFETVTIVYQGEVEHHGSTGTGGRIGPGDVQWMTAVSGILHNVVGAGGLLNEPGLGESQFTYPVHRLADRPDLVGVDNLYSVINNSAIYNRHITTQ